MIQRPAQQYYCEKSHSHVLQDYGGNDYEETTYDYEFERPTLDLEDDAEDALEVSDDGVDDGGHGGGHSGG